MIAQLDEIQWGKLVAEAWINPGFKTELERDPSGTVRRFAETNFGLRLDEVDAFELPELPPGMSGELLSGAIDVRATVTGSASSGGDVRATVTASASSGGDARNN